MYGDYRHQGKSREPPILGCSTFIGFVAAVLQTAIAIDGSSHGHENIALAYFVADNLFTYIVNSVDKCIAILGNPCNCRVPEKLLHLFIIAGGAPATGFAMRPRLNHKCSRRPYQNSYIDCALFSTVIAFLFLP